MPWQTALWAQAAAGHQRWRRQLRGEFHSVFIALRRPSSSTRLTAIVVRRPPHERKTWASTEQAVALLRSAGFDGDDAAR